MRWRELLLAFGQGGTGNAAEDKYGSAFAEVLVNDRSRATPAAGADLFSQANVVIIGELNIPQCKKYRVLQKLEQLTRLGARCDYSFWGDVPRALNLLQTATCVIFYRTHANPAFDALLREARRLGIPVGYDIDDPMFDEAVCSKNRNLLYLSHEDRQRILSDCRSHLDSMRRCDFVIVSTPALAELARAACDLPVFIWRNAIDSETRRLVEVSKHYSVRRPELGVKLCYISGSKAHEADFRVAEQAIHQCMVRHPQLWLRIIGHLEMPDSFAPLRDRIEMVPFVSYEECLLLMAECDVNIIPLEQSVFNECKSAIRYMDASSLGLPTIVSDVGDFKTVVAGNARRFLVPAAEDWPAALEDMLASASFREDLGREAEQHAGEHYSAQAIAETLDPSLLKLLGV